MIEMFTSVMRIYLAFIKSLKSATVSLLAFKTPAPPPKICHFLRYHNYTYVLTVYTVK